MSKDKIIAGKSVVELSLHDKIDQGLQAAKRKLVAFGGTLQAVGGGLFAGGSAALASMVGLASSAAQMAGPIQDLAESTGMTAEDITAMTYAADQAGVSFEQFKPAMRSMSAFSNSVAHGNKAAKKSLDELGISANQFSSANASQKLGLIADGLAKIDDPAHRSALAMKVFGKSGFDMQRMLAGGSEALNQQLQRAGDLGLIFSSEDVAAADAMGDSFGELVKQGQAVVFHLGMAFVSSLSSALDIIKPIVSGLIEFVQANRGLITTIGLIAAGVTAAGALIFGLGTMFVVAGMAIGGVMSAIATVASGIAAAVAFVLSPLFLIPAAIVAAVGYFLFFTQVGRAVAGSIMNAFQQLWDFVGLVYGGMIDAAVSGNWSLVGKIIMAGLNVAWVGGINTLKSLWYSFANYILDTLRETLKSITNLWYDTQAELAKSMVSFFMDAGEQERTEQLNKRLAESQRRHGMKVTAGDSTEKMIDDLFAKRKQEAQAAMGKAGEEDLKKANGDLAAAMDELRKLSSTAMQERLAKAAELKAKVPNIRREGFAPDSSRDIGPSGTMSVLSGFVAGMIGRAAGPDNFAKRTAEAGEKTNDLLQQLIDENEQGLALGND